MSTSRQPEPPFRVIAGRIRDRIESGELRPGDRVPSIRQIAQRWGVAIATATRAAAVLRDEGLVEPRTGAGTVVTGRAGTGTTVATGGRRGPERPATPGPAATVAAAAGPDGQARRDRLLRVAITIADTEGLEAVSMRRLAAHLGVGPMSLYRSVAGKDELLAQMADSAFGEVVLPDPGPPGWRAKLELVARAEWRLFRQHLWLPATVSLTRPMLVPHMMAHSEWTLRALDGLGLPMAVRVREMLTLQSLVLNIGVAVAAEVDAERDSGLPLDRWRVTRRPQVRHAVDPARYPLLAAIPEGTAEDLGELFEYALARHLDGLAVLLERTGGPAEQA
ncbi:TetR/AcrR family transcriptional regulator C-terminal domain-containing protein [Pseudonocardia sp. HH130630-07]|uniref:TetR/AcrR family transcriptional regulator C-terminal domain-containing protein n=1 Tax=Pseudonocardia sp. HH130630-07 TaxID=1690815 RepID=UPI000814F1EA|nr:TetR/AcrR family transcriptional regulator C-terminal domain-containing protein [Pseudonocardia sp. HH130630-07]ANY06840.1 GntR family transcriptional regulator [Pseudonocardia sp. HH130630-07]